MLHELKKHLDILQSTGIIDVWDDNSIQPGQDPLREIEKHFSYAHIILLLLSPDFLSHPTCRNLQLPRALEQHQRGEAIVIPILLRPCYWELTPLRELQLLPRNGTPISSQERDEAFREISSEIGKMMKALR